MYDVSSYRRSVWGQLGSPEGSNQQSAAAIQNPQLQFGVIEEQSAAAICCQREGPATRRTAIRSRNLYGEKFGSKI